MPNPEDMQNEIDNLNRDMTGAELDIIRLKEEMGTLRKVLTFVVKELLVDHSYQQDLLEQLR